MKLQNDPNVSIHLSLRELLCRWLFAEWPVIGPAVNLSIFFSRLRVQIERSHLSSIPRSDRTVDFITGGVATVFEATVAILFVHVHLTLSSLAETCDGA